MAVIMAATLAWSPANVYGGNKSRPILLIEESAGGTEIRKALSDAGFSVLLAQDSNAADASLQARDSARRFLQEARTLYKESKLEKASSKLRLAHRSADLPTLYEVYLLESLIRHAMGDQKATHKALEAYSLLGGPELSHGYYPPAFMNGYRLARASIERRPLASIEINATLTPGIRAEVLVDGARVGEAPLNLTLRTGFHHVAIRAAGHLPFEQLILMRRDGARVTPNLVPQDTKTIAAQAIESSNQDERGKLLAVAERAARAEAVMFVAAGSARLYKSGTQVWSRPSDASFDRRAGREMAAALDAASRSTMIASLRPLDTTVTKEELPGWYSKWWVWTLAGAAAAGGGAYFLLGRNGGGDPASVQLVVNGR